MNHLAQRPTDVEFEYRLTGSGWAECHVAVGNRHVTVTASYTSDALGDLTRAVLQLKNGAISARAQFDEEPGEYRWIFHRNTNFCTVQILMFSEFRGNQPDQVGKLIFYAECSFDAFLTAFIGALQAVLTRYGIEGYQARWIEYEFPLQDYQALLKS